MNIGVFKYPIGLSRNIILFRRLNLKYYSSNTNSETDREEWIRFYRFPYINQARLLNRLKLYQTALTISSVPVSLALYSNDLATRDDCLQLVSLASLACAMLYVMGNIFRRLIGIMDLNKKGDIVRVSRLTFFGGKVVERLPAQSIIPLSEIDFDPRDLLYKLKRYDNAEELFFVLRYGGIIDRERFVKIFGNPPRIT